MKQNAKEFLDSVFILNKKIEAKQKEIDILNALLFKLNKELNFDRVQTSGDKDQLGSTIAKLIDAKTEINNLIDEYVDRMREVNAVLDLITDPKEYDLLHKHYIQGESWSYISQQWDNSNQWVHEIKKNALNSVQEILDRLF